MRASEELCGSCAMPARPLLTRARASELATPVGASDGAASAAPAESQRLRLPPAAASVPGVGVVAASPPPGDADWGGGRGRACAATGTPPNATAAAVAFAAASTAASGFTGSCARDEVPVTSRRSQTIASLESAASIQGSLVRRDVLLQRAGSAPLGCLSTHRRVWAPAPPLLLAASVGGGGRDG